MRSVCNALLCGAATTFFLAVGAPRADAASHVTLMFSRAQIQAVMPPSCTPLAGGVTIWEVAGDLAARGYPATEAVTTTITGDSTGAATATATTR